MERCIGNDLDAVCSGDLGRFSRAWHLVQVKPGGSHRDDQWDPDLVARPRWATLPATTRDRFLEAATTYLDDQPFDREEWLCTGTMPPEALSAVVALVLLARVQPAILDGLPASTWQRWAAALIGYPAGEGGLAWELKEPLISQAMGRAKSRLVDIAEHLFVVVATAGPAAFLEPEVRAIWCPELQERIAAGLDNGTLTDAAWEKAAGLLAELDPGTALPILLRVVADDGATPRRRQLAGSLLIRHGTSSTWEPLFRVLTQRAELGAAIVERYVRDALLEAPIPPLLVNDLADLYLWLVDRYPYAEDPTRSGADWVTPRQQIAEWRDAVLRTIVNKGTDAAVEAVRSIEAALPNEPWLGRLRRQAEEARRQRQWQPVDPTILLGLPAAPSRRLIDSERHLSAVVVEALTSIQEQLTGDNPASHDLWDTHARRPKTEDEISDWFTRHLEHELSDTLTLVDRDVQIRRTGHGIGQRTDILVQIAKPGKLIRLPIESQRNLARTCRRRP
ncbi:MAG: hypothetical protein M3083_10510 [Actinomycetota bacterium]|nr:hypothetical protein [Actinomycetota bacterium]